MFWRACTKSVECAVMYVC